MGLFVGGTPVKSVYVGSTPVTAVYVGSQKVWPTIEVYEVTLTNRSGEGTAHPLVTVSVPAGQTWSVRVQGTMQSTFGQHFGGLQIRIGSSTSSSYGNNASVDYSGTITSANSTIALVTPADSWAGSAGFTGTVTIEK